MCVNENVIKVIFVKVSRVTVRSVINFKQIDVIFGMQINCLLILLTFNCAIFLCSWIQNV